MTKGLAIFLFLVLGCSYVSVAQTQYPLPVSHFPFEVYTAKDGLSQTLSREIAQDIYGNLWVGAREGVNIFDGLEFTNYRNDSRLPDEVLRDILPSPNGDVWITGTVAFYQITPDTSFSYNPCQEGFYPTKIYTDHLNQLCFICSNGKKYQILVKKDNDFILASHLPFDQSGAQYWSYLPKQEGYLRVAFDTERQYQLTWVPLEGPARLLAETSRPIGYPSPLIRLYNDEAFIKINDSIYQFQNEELVPLHQIDPYARNFFIRNEDVIFHNDSSIFKISNGDLIDYGLRLTGITKIFLDSEERLWVSSEEGLIKIISEAFRIYPSDRGALTGTWGVLEDIDQNIWFTSYWQGIQYLDQKKQVYRKTSLFDSIMSRSGDLTHKRYYTGSTTRSNGDLLITTDQYVISLSPEKEVSILDAPYFSNRAVQDIKEYDGELFLASKGLIILSEANPSQRFNEEDDLDTEGLYYFEAVDVDTTGTVWLGSHFGLVKFDRQNTAFHHFYVQEGEAEGINTIFRDPYENLWFGTHNGLELFRYQSDLPEKVLTGQINGSIKTIAYLEEGWLLLGMLDEIVLLDLNKFYQGETIIHRLSDEMGFKGVDCIQQGAFIDSKKHAWIPTRTNVVRFIPHAFHPSSPNLTTHITSLEHSSRTDSLWSETSLSTFDGVFYSTDQVRVHFHTIDHNKPRQINYQFRLHPEDAWTLSSPLRFAQFSNLDVGRYFFEVRACLEGTCYDSILMPFRVKAGELSHSPLFRILLGLVLAGLLVLIWNQSQIQKKRKQEADRLQLKLEKEAAEQAKLQQKLYITQTNPHFVFNSLNSIIGLLASESKEAGISYLSDFGELFRIVLSNNDQFLHTVKTELQLIEQYLRLEKLRFGKRFDYHFNYSELHTPHSLVPKLFVQSFVHNAIKHAIEPKKKEGKIQVIASSQKNTLTFRIIDNGPGYSSTQDEINGSTGQGIKIAYSTLDWIKTQSEENAEIFINDKLDDDESIIGTEVIIHLPADLKIASNESI